MPTRRPKTFRAYVSAGGIPPLIVGRKLGTADQIIALLDGTPGHLHGAHLTLNQDLMEREKELRILRFFVTGSGYRVKKGDLLRLHANCLIYCEGTGSR